MNRFHRNSALVLMVLLNSLVFAGSAWGQFGGLLVVASDSAATSREFTDVPGLCRIHVVHESFSNITDPQYTGVRFKVRDNEFASTWLFDQSQFTTLGDSQRGIIIVYGNCLVPPALILSIGYLCTGMSSCTTITLVPDPGTITGQIEVYGCAGELLSPPAVGELCVNGILIPDDFIGYCGCPMPAEDSTWGQIKAIYH